MIGATFESSEAHLYRRKFLLSYVAALRLATAIVFVLVSLFTAISTGAIGIAAHVLLTLAAATSFLVDIREATSNGHAENTRLKQGKNDIRFYE